MSTLFLIAHQVEVAAITSQANKHAEPGIFARWRGGGVGPGPTARTTFFSPQLILQFTEGSNGYITEKTILFPRIQRGVQHFPGGGGQLFQGGPNAYFYRNLYNL